MRSGRPIEDLGREVRGSSGILFLCSGNMIRSAFAELYARHRGCPIAVRSAATSYRNDALYPETTRALAARGVARDSLAAFRPTHLDDVLGELDERTVVFGMTADHLAALAPRPELAARAHLLPELLGRSGEIADPLFEGGFDSTFALVARCVEGLVALLEE